MNPDQLAAIRQRASDQCGVNGEDADALLAYVDDLHREIATLSAGILATTRALTDPDLEQWDQITQPACTTCGTPTTRGQHCPVCHPDQP